MSNTTCVVRVATSYWKDSRGIHTRRSITALKRLSNIDILNDEANEVGAQGAFREIVNINDVPDGVYELVTCNITRDDESGHIDGWELKLVEYNNSPEVGA